MLDVTMIGGLEILTHNRNEAKTQGYNGFHQFNFDCSSDGDFIIWTPDDNGNEGEKSQNIHFLSQYLQSQGYSFDLRCTILPSTSIVNVIILKKYNYLFLAQNIY